MHKLNFNLQLFADGGAAGTAGNEGVSPEAEATGAEFSDAGRKGKKGNPFENVKFGLQASETQVHPQDGKHVETQKSERTSFDELVKGEYKADFDARVQEILTKRFKANDEREKQLAPALELLGKKYGVDAKDVDKLVEAIKEDDSYYEQEAEKRGISVEQLKYLKKLEMENEQFRKAQEERTQKETAENIYANWLKESESVKQLYPQFDLRNEIKNEKFLSLMKAPGVDVRTAYEIVHKDELIAPAMQYTARQTAKQVTDNIKARGVRPVENGASSQGAAIVKTDPSKLTRAEIEECIRRAMAGEQITF